MMMKISPCAHLQVDVAHRADQPGRGEFGRAGLASRSPDEAGRPAEQLPEIAAGKLHRAANPSAVRGHQSRQSRRHPHDPAGKRQRRPGRRAGSALPVGATTAPRPSSWPRWRRSRRPRRPRSTCRRGRPAPLILFSSSVSIVIGLGHLVGDRPFVLHAGPGVFPDLAMRLAAIIGLVRVDAPFRVGVALRRVFGEFAPTRPCTWPAPNAANRSTA